MSHNDNSRLRGQIDRSSATSMYDQKSPNARLRHTSSINVRIAARSVGPLPPAERRVRTGSHRRAARTPDTPKPAYVAIDRAAPRAVTARRPPPAAERRG